MGAARPIMISGFHLSAARENWADSFKNSSAFSTGFLPVDLAQRT